MVIGATGVVAGLLLLTETGATGLLLTTGAEETGATGVEAELTGATGVLLLYELASLHQIVQYLSECSRGGWLGDGAWAVGDGQGGGLGDGVGLAVVGEGGGLRAVGGEGSDDLSHVDVGRRAVRGRAPASHSLSGDSANEGGSSDRVTHLDDIRWIVDLKVVVVSSFLRGKASECGEDRCVDVC